MRLTGGVFGFRITSSASCAAAAYRPCFEHRDRQPREHVQAPGVEVALGAVSDPGAQVLVGAGERRLRT